ncbi:MAG: riboflavin synthase [Ehrlichia sp.]
MFKGIIVNTGTVIHVRNKKNLDVRVLIKPQDANFLNESKLGSSVACSGICLSIIELGNEYFAVDISQATLSVTNATHWKEGTNINLELPLKFNDRLDGHLIQGHIDDIGTITSITEENSSHNMEFRIPDRLLKYITTKGSIAIDGVSLTINSIDNQTLSVNIIPHTWKNTIFQYNKVNDSVNIETDMIARHIERLYQFNK